MSLIDNDTLSAIFDEWIEYALLLAPTLLLALGALVFRFNVAVRANRAFDQLGRGLWLDGSSVFKVRVQAPTNDWLSIGQVSTNKSGTQPSSATFVLEQQLTLLTEQGEHLLIPLQTPMELGAPKENTLRYERVSNDPNGKLFRVQLHPGAEVWIRAWIDAQQETGPMRSSSVRTTAQRKTVQLSAAEAPAAPETSLDGPFALLYLATCTNIWCACAEGTPQYFSFAVAALLSALSLNSLFVSSGFHKQLNAQRF